MKRRKYSATFGGAWSNRRRRFLERLVMKEVLRHPDVVHVVAREGNWTVSYVG